MTGNAYTVFNAMVDIVASPGRALDEVRQHTSWLWWPLLVSMLLGAVLFIFYYNWVDFPWLVEETIRQMPAENRAEAADYVRQSMQVDRQMWVTIVGIAIMTPIIYGIQATYLHLANKLVTGAQISYGGWFSFATWTNFVTVFGTLAAFATIFIADSNQLSPQALAALSINSLLLHANPGDAWFTWASTLTLIHFWMLGLMVIGFARWTNTAMGKSSMIVLLPWVLIFGVWALII